LNIPIQKTLKNVDMIIDQSAVQMTAKDNYSFEPVGNVDPSTTAVEAVPFKNSPESCCNEEECTSDAAIMVGCGLLGWVVW